MDRDVKLEKAIGQRIKEFRESLGWSQEHLAALAGTEKKQIQRTESGRFSPVFKTLTGVARALGRQPWELCKVDYQIKVNTDLRPGTPKSPGTATFIHKLFETNFLDTPRAVKDVVQEVEVRYEVTLTSSAVSGMLKTLVEQKALKRLNAEIKGRFVYQKPKRKR
ncbi:MAG: helix-turn-helix domain-containing protein [Bacteroidota bacterium]|nr:helix-turn-helix domain-containing protein [Bacteroidota bacterium]